jgi:two-component system, chemotaxis family, chemotaxis protein CheY
MRLKVLIVDADSASCETMHTAMVASNLDAITETDSGRAAESLTREKYDALFFELRMPAPDGAQLARTARSSGLNRRTPIIMVSGQDAPDAMSRAFEAGANFFLYKPFDRGRLMRVLRAAHAPIEQERRRFHRVQVSKRVSVECGADKLEGTTIDLSLQGMLVEVPRAFVVGSQVKLRLDVGGQRPVNAAGKIVRVAAPTKMGIELEGLSGDDAERLQAFLLPLILKSVGE